MCVSVSSGSSSSHSFCLVTLQQDPKYAVSGTQIGVTLESIDRIRCMGRVGLAGYSCASPGHVGLFW